MSKIEQIKKTMTWVRYIDMWCDYEISKANKALCEISKANKALCKNAEEEDPYYLGYSAAAKAIGNVVKSKLEELENEKKLEMAKETQRNCRIAVIFTLISIFASFFSLMKAGM